MAKPNKGSGDKAAAKNPGKPAEKSPGNAGKQPKKAAGKSPDKAAGKKRAAGKTPGKQASKGGKPAGGASKQTREPLQEGRTHSPGKHHQETKSRNGMLGDDDTEGYRRPTPPRKR